MAPQSARVRPVLLCSMPFGLVVTPSLALGLLQASIAALPVQTRQLYPSLRFLRGIGYDAYRTITERWEIGDWVFAQAAFPDRDLDPDGFVEQVIRRPPEEYETILSVLEEKDARDLIERSAAAAAEARRHVPQFLDECLRVVRQQEPTLIGFSCLFQQRLASVALARLIKDTLPGVLVIFGGPECHDVRGLELLRQFPFIDAVVSGPGDVVFPEVVRRRLADEPLEGLTGVYTQRQVAGAPLGVPLDAPLDAPSPATMDDLPYPLFDDYFADLEAAGVELPVRVYLSLETSRGCWWGEHPRRHCTFCGLNGRSVNYRSKSSTRMVEELGFFARTHPGKALIMTDSILDMGYFKEAIPALAEQRLATEIQYETRPTLTKDQLYLLGAAGIVQIQPGIESLSTPVLQLLRKGTTALDNVQLLKWTRELGLRVLWNLLAGAPGEPPEAYLAMERLIPLLTHLPPPARFRYITLVRRSPLFEEAQAFALSGVAPAAAYSYIFATEPQAIANLATTFTYARPGRGPGGDHTRGVQEAVWNWKQVHAGSQLLVTDDDASSFIVDRRPIARERIVVLRGLEQFVHAACDAVQRVSELAELAANGGFPGVSPAQVRQALAALEARGLMISEEDRYLSLAVRILTPEEKKRFRAAMRGAAP